MTSLRLAHLPWIAVAALLLALATATAAWLDNEISLLSQAMLYLVAVLIPAPEPSLVDARRR